MSVFKVRTFECRGMHSGNPIASVHLCEYPISVAHTASSLVQCYMHPCGSSDGSPHLVVGPGGLALLGEGSHTLLLVGGSEEGLEDAALEAETLLKRELLRWRGVSCCAQLSQVYTHATHKS